jgi:F0F1-type ATP synthase assembly protein I
MKATFKRKYMPSSSELLIEGLSDAVGFVVGALVGYWLGGLLGMDIFQAGYDTGSIVGIVLIGVGGGVGLRVARKWRQRQKN